MIFLKNSNLKTKFDNNQAKIEGIYKCWCFYSNLILTTLFVQLQKIFSILRNSWNDKNWKAWTQRFAKWGILNIYIDSIGRMELVTQWQDLIVFQFRIPCPCICSVDPLSLSLKKYLNGYGSKIFNKK